jgi:site-specific recombinase XerD
MKCKKGTASGVLDPDLAPLVTHILQGAQPDSPKNPWSSQHVRLRNFLIVFWLVTVGLRRGELARLRISNFNDAMSQVTIVPNANTSGRTLPVNDQLAHLTRAYVLTERSNIPGAREHDLLFVATNTGEPLSVSVISRVFKTIQEAIPDLPVDLSPNWCRDAWNQRFSQVIDDMNKEKEVVSEASEQQIRNYLMGFSRTSRSGRRNA